MSGRGLPLRSLVQGLRATTDPWQRLRLLAEASRALEMLSGERRGALLQRLGLSAAAPLLERLGTVASRSPEDLEAVLRELEADPLRLRRWIDGLRSPQQRKETLEEILATLESSSGSVSTGPPGSGPVSPPSPPEHRVPHPLADDEETGAARPTPVATSSEVPAPEPPPRPPARPAEVADPTPQDSDVSPSDRPVAMAPPLVRTERATAPPRARKETPEGRLWEPPPEGGPLHRLLALRRSAGRRPISPRLVEALHAAFPDGWQRRRAVCALLEEAPALDASSAAALLGSLSQPRDRRWCLSVLTRRHDWSAAERRALAARLAERPGIGAASVDRAGSVR